MFDMTKIGLNIARLRKESGMTQMELADRLGISYQAVSSWERGSTMPDISKLPLLADSFGVSIDDILSGGRGADLVRKIVSGPVEETLQPGEVSAEEFQELAPLLPSKQADAVFGRTEQPSGLGELIAVAPFISEDVLGECALRAFGTVALSELVALAPFLDEKAVDELALRAYGTSGVSGMVALAPFMDRDRLDALARGIAADSGKEGVAAPAPPAAPSAPAEVHSPQPEDREETDGPKMGSHSSSFADPSR
ncbi:helix-turn-helix transcriptional regulator [Saccharibacillus sacchari]|uniref:Helix-turn-helix transcriptional regulator n=1 Tax=Saccharibacillus sacchari TaxID=456493 RepID=A0ACC6P954_9BACL